MVAKKSSRYQAAVKPAKQKRYVCLSALVILGGACILLHQPQRVIAHGGGLDSYGCHNDRRAGEYHCHRGSLAGRTFRSQSEMLKALKSAPPEGPRPAARPLRAPIAPAPPTARPTTAYNRDLYGSWIDQDGDCQNTRLEVLIAESLVPATLDSSGCNVVAGLWFDPYVGQIFNNPSDLEVDHFIPLAEVHRSGGDRWTPERRQAYANDLSDSSTLIAVSAAANRSKSDEGPDKWMPINKEFRCPYVVTWVQVKRKWNLETDAAEQAAINDVIATCRR
jgi:hypothetical protein